jgi:hypothetical protein
MRSSTPSSCGFDVLAKMFPRVENRPDGYIAWSGARYDKLNDALQLAAAHALGKSFMGKAAAVSNRHTEGGGVVDEKENQAYGRLTREPLPLRLAPRCLARTRSGTPCQKPAAKGKKRCRLHGGAEGSGAPRGERNGSYRHGLYTREAIVERRALRALIRGFREDTRGALSSGAKPSRASS